MLLYTIIVIGSLFGGQANTDMQFVTLDACRNIAVKMTNASGLKHVCQPVK